MWAVALTAKSVTRGPCHVWITVPSTRQRITFLSTPAETKQSPDGSHAQAVTLSRCFANVRTHLRKGCMNSAVYLYLSTYLSMYTSNIDSIQWANP